MTTWLTPAATAGALALIYLTCLRPMLRGHRAGTGAACCPPGEKTSAATDLDDQIRKLREDVALLRQQAQLRRANATANKQA